MITQVQQGEGVGILPAAAIPWVWAALGGTLVSVGSIASWEKAKSWWTDDLRDYVVAPTPIQPAPTVHPAAPTSLPTMTVPTAWNPDEMWNQTVLQQRQVTSAFNAGARQSSQIFSDYFGANGADASALSPWLFAAVAGLAVALVMR